jgi:hypothetical protein
MNRENFKADPLLYFSSADYLEHSVLDLPISTQFRFSEATTTASKHTAHVHYYSGIVHIFAHRLLETMLRLETTIYTDFSNAEINVTRFQE